MQRTFDEKAQTERFGDAYARSLAPVMLSIERRVCGCDYGGSSWMTLDQVNDLIGGLDLRPGRRLLDLGAGTGWPALYMTEESGCEAVLVDLPPVAIKIARERAISQGIGNRVTAIVGDAARLPFEPGSFDAISHSDLLCCLVQKRSVLAECRRVIRPDGRMVFTVISIPSGLGPDDYARAVANGPEFIECETDYTALLEHTGWTVTDCRDLSEAYAASCARQIAADEEHGEALASLIGVSEYAERLVSWREKLIAIRDGLVRREMFAVVPAPGR